jgi:hypothetical protein
MANIVKFPKEKKPAPLAVTMEHVKAAMPRGSTVLAILAWAWCIVRLPLFLVLYWLRGPVRLLCSLISGPMLVAWLFSLYAFPDKQFMVWGFAIMSFGAFVIMWVYDLLLMALSPMDMIQTL